MRPPKDPYIRDYPEPLLRYAAVQPASAGMIAPLIRRDSSDARNSASDAMSLGSRNAGMSAA